MSSPNESSVRPWAVEVNEAKIWATASLDGREWWNQYRGHLEHQGRVTVTTPSLGGDMVLVAVDDDEHAQWLVDVVIGNTAPGSARRVRPAVTA